MFFTSRVGGLRVITRTRRLIGATVIIPLVVAGVLVANVGPATRRSGQVGAAVTGIHKIKHVIVIMQENRSFDTYFGTYPGASGIPMANGVPTVCNPDPAKKTCDKPYVDHHDVMQGGPHGDVASRADIDGTKMDGFVRIVDETKSGCAQFAVPDCADGPANSTDVMGYHTGSDIPNYWSYAKNFVLQDHMFEPVASWSLPEHLFMVSEWSAACATHAPSSCVNNIHQPGPSPGNQDPTSVQAGAGSPIYAWTDLTYLFFKNHVSWGYYVTPGTQPDCTNDQTISCIPVPQGARTLGIWNPLPYFDTVHADNQLGNIQSVSNFYNAAKTGTLPAVSWVVPSGDVSEHPPATTSAGQTYVTSLINAVMRGPDWSSTAIFLAWDDWGGFYDGVKPPIVDKNGYGLRVPGLVISPYAKKGYIDHQALSFDAYVKFIEDDFLNSKRLDPKTDGRPDPRPDVRENAVVLGDLVNDFDFTQAPRPPVLLPVHPKTTLTNRVPFQPVGVALTPGDAAVSMIWSTPLSNGGLPITGYKIFPILAGVPKSPTTVGPGGTSAVLTGLVNGATYTFKIAATNQLGGGVWGIPTPASVTVGAPWAPLAATAVAGTGGATVRWQAPLSDDGSPITGYHITPHVSGASRKTVTVGPFATSVTIAGLVAGGSYSFSIVATNARGSGVVAATSAVIVK